MASRRSCVSDKGMISAAGDLHMSARVNKERRSQINETISTFGTFPRRKPNWALNECKPASHSEKTPSPVRMKPGSRRTMEDMMWRPLRRTFSDEPRTTYKDDEWSEVFEFDQFQVSGNGVATCGQRGCGDIGVEWVDDKVWNSRGGSMVWDERVGASCHADEGVLGARARSLEVLEDQADICTTNGIVICGQSNCVGSNKSLEDASTVSDDVTVCQISGTEVSYSDENVLKTQPPCVIGSSIQNYAQPKCNDSNSMPNSMNVSPEAGVSRPQTSSTITSSPDTNILTDVVQLENTPIELLNHTSLLHKSLIRMILGKDYTHDTQMRECLNDVENLLVELRGTIESLQQSHVEQDDGQLAMCKDEMISVTKEFVTDAKLLVASITRSSDSLWSNVTRSMHTLARLFLHAQATILLTRECEDAEGLARDVIRVTNAYKNTINAARISAGQQIHEPHLKYIMKLATSLANFISILLTKLKSVSTSTV